MKLKILPIIFYIFIFVLTAFTQTENARKLDEFSYLPCDDLLARAHYAASVELQKELDAKIYFIYYECLQDYIYTFNNCR